MLYTRIILVFLLCILFAINAHCQKEAANWFFGYSAGLSFNSLQPTALGESGLKAVEGCAVISDNVSGTLLFYTDGRNFWNSDHRLMPSSNTLPSNCATSITQPAIIIPDKNDKNLYHTFCIRPIPEFTQGVEPNCIFSRTENVDDGLGLLYNLIDMNLDEGRGDIVRNKSNVMLRSDVTEKLTAVPHSNGTDYWVIVHGWNNNRFYTYQLSSGTILPPVVTDIGSIHGFHDYEIDIYQELSGQMKASPDGKKIACAVSLSDRPFDLFDFNNSTGKLSNYINLGNVLGQYGTSFSPDNNRLYVTSDGREEGSNNRSVIIQFDLAAASEQNIINSRMSIVAGNPNTNIPPSGVFDGFDLVKKGMGLGIDGRLYIAGNSDYINESIEPHLMVVIDRPNEKGFDCRVNQRTFNFNKGRVTIGLPNFMQSYFNNIESASTCGQGTSIKVYPNPTSDLIAIELLQGCNQNLKIEILNALGQTLITTEGNIVDLTALASGVYFCKVVTDYHQYYITKIVRK